MTISRRELTRLLGGFGAAAALGGLGRSASVAQTAGYKAMVGIFLFGGNDGWNMVVPTDSRYAAYASTRGAQLALQQSSLQALGGTALGLHPSLAPLAGAWDAGDMNVVLNVGSLLQPMTRQLYIDRPDLRPLNLMSHSDEQAHWQGFRMREANVDGFMGRIADRLPPSAMPQLMSISGSQLAILGDESSPLILPSTGSIVRNGYNAASTSAAVRARQTALETFSDATQSGEITNLTGQAISRAYAQAIQANTIVSAPAASSAVDAHFVNPATGAALTSDISRQLLRAARMIEARSSLGHSQQIFFVSQGGYDTHAGQVNANTAQGTHATLLADLGLAMTGFYNAMKALNLSNSVTQFTLSDFGRVYRGNAQSGTDHAWGSNALVVGGAVRERMVHGAYPTIQLGGPDDATSDGRWIPTIASDEYVGAVAQWFGVAAADMGYVFPNWATWNGGGRGPVPLFA